MLHDKTCLLTVTPPLKNGFRTPAIDYINGNRPDVLKRGTLAYRLRVACGYGYIPAEPVAKQTRK